MKQKKNNKKKKKNSRPTQTRISHKREYLGMAVITALCLLVFGRNVTFDAFLIDVPKIIFENPHIITGVTWDNIVYSFTEPNMALYHPLPNLAYMLESHLFGLWPGGYHGGTVLWHIVTMCLFLWVMMRLINNFPVVFAATLVMCIHPVQIMVASQIATRHEIMQAFFMLLSIEAYRRYVKSGSRRAYIFSVVLMGLGLLCKQVIVMLPVALLLLDYWPLNRIEISFQNFRKTLQTAVPLVLEKIPFFVLSVVGSFLAFYGKMQYNQISYHVGKLTIPDAIYFVVTGYARYVGHLVYPFRLSYFEVYSEEKTLFFFLISAAVLTLITTVALVTMRKRPYLITGWLWFFLFIFPVSGVVRYMMESIALRYLYVPAMGLYLALFMGIYEFAMRKKDGAEELESNTPASPSDRVPRAYWTGVSIATAILTVLAFWQNGFFRDTETTAMHLQEVTGDKSVFGHNALAVLRVREQRFDEAEVHFRRSVEIQPDNCVFRYYYGTALYGKGKYQEVVDTMAPAVEAVPDAPEYLELYALGLMATGRNSSAEEYLGTALKLDPDTVSTIQNMAYCLILGGKYEDAIPYIKRIVEADPANESAKTLADMVKQATGKSVKL